MLPDKISIIIPAYNCSSTISRTIQTVLTASRTYRDRIGLAGREPFVEVIVVDDGSRDSTRDEIQKFPIVKYYFQHNAGPASARNHGASEARGEILFFTDADCQPRSDWILKMMPYFSDPGLAVVCGSYGLSNPKNRLSRCIHSEIIYRHRILLPDYPAYFGSFNFAIRHSVFDEVGGFDVRYRHASGEDNDLSYKISSRKKRIFFAKDALVDHEHPSSWGKYLAEQYRHGFWRVTMYRDHPVMARGDGYTFWKDVFEVALVLIVYSSMALIFMGLFRFAIWGVTFGVCCLLVLNIYFGIVFCARVPDGLYYGDVMVSRAFARTNGFIAGLCHRIKIK